MKNPLIVGDRVRHKIFPNLLGVGIVINVYEISALIKWERTRAAVHGLRHLQLYETPIQRMKRLYSET